MKIDFHTHGKLAKCLPFSPEYTKRVFTEARRAGLDAICLTEHFNTEGLEELYDFMENNMPRSGDCFLWDHLKIFPGMEIDIAEGGHVLAIGKAEDILALNRLLTHYRQKEAFLSFERLLALTSEYDLLLGAAHPFRKGSKLPKLPEELLEQFDFVDLNGKDLAEGGQKIKEKVCAFAAALGVPVAAGSDTHQAFQFGCIYSRLPDCTTIEELRRNLEDTDNLIVISKHSAFQVKTAGTLKRALKEIHALGGDYVSVLIREKEKNIIE